MKRNTLENIFVGLLLFLGLLSYFGLGALLREMGADTGGSLNALNFLSAFFIIAITAGIAYTADHS